MLGPATLDLMAHGTVGGLCIGGCQLAQGYRNRPDATAAQFFTHTQFGRLYRSGDRCHVDPITLRVHFHGRLDAQLKVRGFRVEAQPIESLLQDHFAEFDTAVLDCQNSELIAFIRAPSLWHQTQANATHHEGIYGLHDDQVLCSAAVPLQPLPANRGPSLQGEALGQAYPVTGRWFPVFRN